MCFEFDPSKDEYVFAFTIAGLLYGSFNDDDHARFLRLLWLGHMMMVMMV